VSVRQNQTTGECDRRNQTDSELCSPTGKVKVKRVPYSIQLKGSVKEPNMFHSYETEKITCKASDVAENLQLYRVVRFFHPRLSCTTHLMLFSECPPIYVSCMTISVEEPNNTL